MNNNSKNAKSYYEDMKNNFKIAKIINKKLYK